MNVRVEELSSIKKKLFIEVAEDVVTSELNDAYKKIAKTANIKGFRKGKVPRAILEQHYGPKAQYDAVGSLINNSLYKAIVDEKLDAVSQPEVVQSSEVEVGKPFTYEAEVEIRPVVEAKDYTGIEVDKEVVPFDEESVEKQLESMAANNTQLEVTKRKLAREGDTVIIDFEGFIDGTAFENGAAKDYQLELGSNSFIPGFEDQVAGMKREQEKEIEVSFPEGYGAKDLAGKPAVFKVLLKEIKEKIVPKFNDDFAKQFDAENMDALRERLKENTIAQEAERSETQVTEAIVNELIARNEFDVPDGMVKNQLNYLKDSFTQRLQSQGMTLEMLGMSDDSFAATYREMAVQQVKADLLVASIAQQENFDASDEDVDAKIKELAESNNAPLEQVQQYFDNEQAKAGIKSQIVHDKVLKYLRDNAKITEVEKELVTPENAGAEEE